MNLMKLQIVMNKIKLFIYTILKALNWFNEMFVFGIALAIYGFLYLLPFILIAGIILVS